MADDKSNDKIGDDCSKKETDLELSESGPEMFLDQPSPQESPRTKQPREEKTSSSPCSSNPPSPRNLMVAASPPKFVSFEDIMKAANGVQNMALAHEITVDNDFRFQKAELTPNSFEKQVHDIMHKAFWDALEDKLNDDPPDFSQALSLLSEVKEVLGEVILPHQQRLKSQIDEVIDLDLVKQQVENGTLDFMAYADIIISFMAKLCAPARDDEVAKLREITAIVPLYREMMQVLDNMKMDMANFTIQQIRPYLQQQSVTYERTKFSQFLEQQKENRVDGLAATRSWVERAGLNSIKDADENAAAANARLSPGAILNTAYMELFDWPENLIYPETLLMDQQRFMDLSEKSHWLTLMASVLLVTFNTVGAAIAGLSDLKVNLKKHLSAILVGTDSKKYSELMPNVSAQVISDVSSSLEERGFPALSEERIQLLKGQIESVVSNSHPVHKLIRGRLMAFIEGIMQKKSTTELQLPPGFSAFSEELSHICGQFMRLMAHNRTVFGLYYANIIEDFIKRNDTLPTS